MLRKVILSGVLGKTFGREHRLDVRTPGEAVRALCANFPAFAQYVGSSEERGVAYKVLVDAAPLGEIENLHKPFSKTFRIVPVIAGAKSGLFGFLAGAALIGASFFMPGAALFTIGTFAPSLASISFGLGSSLLLGGISSIISPQPSAPKASESERPENKPSAYFNGAVNTTAQGQCVPVGYGRLLIGSHVVSFGITSDNYNASGM